MSSKNDGRYHQSDGSPGTLGSALPKKAEILPSRRNETFHNVEKGRANFFFDEAQSNIFSETQKQSASFSKEEQEFTSASSGKNPGIPHFDSLRASAEKLEELKFTLGNEQISAVGDLQQSLALSCANTDRLNFTFGDMPKELGKQVPSPSNGVFDRQNDRSTFSTIDEPNRTDNKPKVEKITVSRSQIGRGSNQSRDRLAQEPSIRQDPVAPHSSPQKPPSKLPLPPRLIVHKREQAIPVPENAQETAPRQSSRPLPQTHTDQPRLASIQLPKRLRTPSASSQTEAL